MDAPQSLLEMLVAPGRSGPEAPVMTLPSVTLFPQETLPLYIFEPQYRRMLADVLATHRMFVVAMQKPATPPTPATVAGLGLIRVCVQNPDGTSHLILQGVERVELTEAVRTRPYRIYGLRALPIASADTGNIAGLLAKVRALVSQRIDLELPQNFPALKLKGQSKQTIMAYLNKMNNPDEVTDLVSCFLISGAVARQTILETVEVEPRLKHLIRFLMEEINLHRKRKKL
jgi:Lon protease-like protein